MIRSDAEALSPATSSIPFCPRGTSFGIMRKEVRVSYSHNGQDFDPQRRSLLRAGTAAAGLSVLTPFFSAPLFGAEVCQPPIPKNHVPSNGGTCPFPIPWLDKNGNHNQMPKPDVELSNIFHFQREARALCRIHWHGDRQQGQSAGFRYPYHRLQLHVGRILGSAPAAARHVRPYMTHVIQGTGGPCEPSPRLPSSYLARRHLLGGACV